MWRLKPLGFHVDLPQHRRQHSGGEPRRHSSSDMPQSPPLRRNRTHARPGRCRGPGCRAAAESSGLGLPQHTLLSTTTRHTEKKRVLLASEFTCWEHVIVWRLALQGESLGLSAPPASPRARATAAQERTEDGTTRRPRPGRSQRRLRWPRPLAAPPRPHPRPLPVPPPPRPLPAPRPPSPRKRKSSPRSERAVAPWRRRQLSRHGGRADLRAEPG